MSDVTELRRQVSLWDAVMLAAGAMVGSGIFFVPSTIARELPHPLAYLGIWLLGGGLSLMGALTIAELGAAMPQAGGHYVYLRKTYGDAVAFLAGWTSFAVIMTASIAAVAVAAAQCLRSLFGGGSVPWMAVGLIVLLTLVNAAGVRHGARLGNITTAIKLLVMSLAIGAGLWGLLSSGPEHVTTLMTLPADHSWGWGAVSIALMAVLWAFDGWIQVSFVAGEIREPTRTLPRALLLATLGVTVLYVLINAAYLSVLPIPAIAQSDNVLIDMMSAIFPALNLSRVVLLALLIAALGACNSFILCGSRIYYAMAHDGLFFTVFARLNHSGVPALSLLGQGLWASVLVFLGSFEQLFTDAMFASWLFYALMASCVIVLRRRYPERELPYRVWGYPVLPLVFITLSVVLMVASVLTSPRESLSGFGIILLGLPVYMWRKRKLVRQAI